MKVNFSFTVIMLVMMVSCQKESLPTNATQNSIEEKLLVEDYKLVSLEFHSMRNDRNNFLSQFSKDIQELADQGMKTMMTYHPNGFESDKKFEMARSQYLSENQISYLDQIKVHDIGSIFNKLLDLESKMKESGMTKHEIYKIERQIVKQLNSKS